jgi:hypothetical protein
METIIISDDEITLNSEFGCFKINVSSIIAQRIFYSQKQETGTRWLNLSINVFSKCSETFLQHKASC